MIAALVVLAGLVLGVVQPPARQLVFLQQAHEHRSWATVRFLRTLIANGQLARHRVGGRVLVDLDELDQLAERGRIEPPPALRMVGHRAAGFRT